MESLENNALGSTFMALHGAMASCMEESLRDLKHEFGEVHQIDLELGQWANLLSVEYEGYLSVARKELAAAEFCAASGLYRQAFASLRLFLELSFASVYFSAHEFERRRWEADLADFSWANALDDQAGLLSKDFVRAFQPLLVEHSGRYSANAAVTYRYCSQFIHGKASHSRKLPVGVEYSGAVLDDWLTHAKKAGESVLFLLVMRYGEKLNEVETDDLLAATEERFANLSGLRRMIGLADV